MAKLHIAGTHEGTTDCGRKVGAEHYQVCHHSATADPDVEENDDDLVREGVVCRGWFDEFYVKRGTAVAAIQIAERLGKLGTADPKDYPL